MTPLPRPISRRTRSDFLAFPGGRGGISLAAILLTTGAVLSGARIAADAAPDAPAFEPGRTFRHDGRVTAVTASPDGAWLVSSGAEGKLRFRRIGEPRVPGGTPGTPGAGGPGAAGGSVAEDPSDVVGEDPAAAPLDDPGAADEDGDDDGAGEPEPPPSGEKRPEAPPPVAVERSPRGGLTSGPLPPPVDVPLDLYPVRGLSFTADSRFVVCTSVSVGPAGDKGRTQVAVFSPGSKKAARAIDYPDLAARTERDEPGRGSASRVEPLPIAAAVVPPGRKTDAAGAAGASGAATRPGAQVLVQRTDTVPEIVDVSTGKHVWSVKASQKTTACAIAEGGRKILRAVDGEVELADFSTGKESWSRKVFTAGKKELARCDGLRIAPDGVTALATWEIADAQGLRTAEGVALLDLGTGDVRWKCQVPVPEHNGSDRIRLDGVAVGRTFVAVLAGPEVQVFSIADGAAGAPVRLAEEFPTAIGIGADGDSFWVAGFRGEIAEFVRKR